MATEAVIIQEPVSIVEKIATESVIIQEPISIVEKMATEEVIIQEPISIVKTAESKHLTLEVAANNKGIETAYIITESNTGISKGESFLVSPEISMVANETSGMLEHTEVDGTPFKEEKILEDKEKTVVWIEEEDRTRDGIEKGDMDHGLEELEKQASMDSHNPIVDNLPSMVAESEEVARVHEPEENKCVNGENDASQDENLFDTSSIKKTKELQSQASDIRMENIVEECPREETGQCEIDEKTDQDFSTSNELCKDDANSESEKVAVDAIKAEDKELAMTVASDEMEIDEESAIAMPKEYITEAEHVSNPNEKPANPMNAVYKDANIDISGETAKTSTSIEEATSVKDHEDRSEGDGRETMSVKEVHEESEMEASGTGKENPETKEHPIPDISDSSITDETAKESMKEVESSLMKLTEEATNSNVTEMNSIEQRAKPDNDPSPFDEKESKEEIQQTLEEDLVRGSSFELKESRMETEEETSVKEDEAEGEKNVVAVKEIGLATTEHDVIGVEGANIDVNSMDFSVTCEKNVEAPKPREEDGMQDKIQNAVSEDRKEMTTEDVPLKEAIGDEIKEHSTIPSEEYETAEERKITDETLEKDRAYKHLEKVAADVEVVLDTDKKPAVTGALDEMKREEESTVLTPEGKQEEEIPIQQKNEPEKEMPSCPLNVVHEDVNTAISRETTETSTSIREKTSLENHEERSEREGREDSSTEHQQNEVNENTKTMELEISNDNADDLHVTDSSVQQSAENGYEKQFEFSDVQPEEQVDDAMVAVKEKEKVSEDASKASQSSDYTIPEHIFTEAAATDLKSETSEMGNENTMFVKEAYHLNSGSECNEALKNKHKGIRQELNDHIEDNSKHEETKEVSEKLELDNTVENDGKQILEEDTNNDQITLKEVCEGSETEALGTAKEEITLIKVKEELVCSSSFELEESKMDTEEATAVKERIDTADLDCTSQAAEMLETNLKEAKAEAEEEEEKNEINNVSDDEDHGNGLGSADIDAKSAESCMTGEKDIDIPQEEDRMQDKILNAGSENQMEMTTDEIPLKDIIGDDVKEHSAMHSEENDATLLEERKLVDETSEEDQAQQKHSENVVVDVKVVQVTGEELAITKGSEEMRKDKESIVPMPEGEISEVENIGLARKNQEGNSEKDEILEESFKQKNEPEKENRACPWDAVSEDVNTAICAETAETSTSIEEATPVKDQDERSEGETREDSPTDHLQASQSNETVEVEISNENADDLHVTDSFVGQLMDNEHEKQYKFSDVEPVENEALEHKEESIQQESENRSALPKDAKENVEDNLNQEETKEVHEGSTSIVKEECATINDSLKATEENENEATPEVEVCEKLEPDNTVENSEKKILEEEDNKKDQTTLMTKTMEEKAKEENTAAVVSITEESKEEIAPIEVKEDHVPSSSVELGESKNDTEEENSASCTAETEETNIKEADAELEKEKNQKCNVVVIEENSSARTEHEHEQIRVSSAEIDVKSGNSYVTDEKDMEIPEEEDAMQDKVHNEGSENQLEMTTKEIPLKEILGDEVKEYEATLIEERKITDETSEKDHDSCEHSETPVPQVTDEKLIQNEDNPLADVPKAEPEDTGNESRHEVEEQLAEESNLDVTDVSSGEEHGELENQTDACKAKTLPVENSSDVGLERSKFEDGKPLDGTMDLEATLGTCKDGEKATKEENSAKNIEKTESLKEDAEKEKENQIPEMVTMTYNARVADYRSVSTECFMEAKSKEQIVAENLEVKEHLTNDGEASHITKELEEMRQAEESGDPVSLCSEDREAEEKTEVIIDDSKPCHEESCIEAVTEVTAETSLNDADKIVNASNISSAETTVGNIKSDAQETEVENVWLEEISSELDPDVLTKDNDEVQKQNLNMETVDKDEAEVAEKLEPDNTVENDGKQILEKEDTNNNQIPIEEVCKGSETAASGTAKEEITPIEVKEELVCSSSSELEQSKMDTEEAATVKEYISTAVLDCTSQAAETEETNLKEAKAEPEEEKNEINNVVDGEDDEIGLESADINVKSEDLCVTSEDIETPREEDRMQDKIPNAGSENQMGMTIEEIPMKEVSGDDVKEGSTMPSEENDATLIEGKKIVDETSEEDQALHKPPENVVDAKVVQETDEELAITKGSDEMRKDVESIVPMPEVKTSEVENIGFIQKNQEENSHKDEIQEESFKQKNEPEEENHACPLDAVSEDVNTAICAKTAETSTSIEEATSVKDHDERSVGEIREDSPTDHLQTKASYINETVEVEISNEKADDLHVIDSYVGQLVDNEHEKQYELLSVQPVENEALEHKEESILQQPENCSAQKPEPKDAMENLKHEETKEVHEGPMSIVKKECAIIDDSLKATEENENEATPEVEVCEKLEPDNTVANAEKQILEEEDNKKDQTTLMTETKKEKAKEENTAAVASITVTSYTIIEETESIEETAKPNNGSSLYDIVQESKEEITPIEVKEDRARSSEFELKESKNDTEEEISASYPAETEETNIKEAEADADAEADAEAEREKRNNEIYNVVVIEENSSARTEHEESGVCSAEIDVKSGDSYVTHEKDMEIPEEEDAVQDKVPYAGSEDQLEMTTKEIPLKETLGDEVKEYEATFSEERKITDETSDKDQDQREHSETPMPQIMDEKLMQIEDNPLVDVPKAESKDMGNESGQVVEEQLAEESNLEITDVSTVEEHRELENQTNACEAKALPVENPSDVGLDRSKIEDGKPLDEAVDLEATLGTHKDDEKATEEEKLAKNIEKPESLKEDTEIEKENQIPEMVIMTYNAKVEDYSSVSTECFMEAESKEQIVAENLEVKEHSTNDGEASHITKELEEMRQAEESGDPVSLRSKDREAEEKTEEIIDDSKPCHEESCIEVVTEVTAETSLNDADKIVNASNISSAETTVGNIKSDAQETEVEIVQLEEISSESDPDIRTNENDEVQKQNLNMETVDKDEAEVAEKPEPDNTVENDGKQILEKEDTNNNQIPIEEVHEGPTLIVKEECAIINDSLKATEENENEATPEVEVSENLEPDGTVENTEKQILEEEDNKKDQTSLMTDTMKEKAEEEKNAAVVSITEESKQETTPIEVKEDHVCSLSLELKESKKDIEEETSASCVAETEETNIKETEAHAEVEKGKNEINNVVVVEENSLARSEHEESGVCSAEIDVKSGDSHVTHEKDMEKEEDAMQDKVPNAGSEDQMEMTTKEIPLKEILGDDVKEYEDTLIEERKITDETSEKDQGSCEHSETPVPQITDEKSIQNEDSPLVDVPKAKPEDTGNESGHEVEEQLAGKSNLEVTDVSSGEEHRELENQTHACEAETLPVENSSDVGLERSKFEDGKPLDGAMDLEATLGTSKDDKKATGEENFAKNIEKPESLKEETEMEKENQIPEMVITNYSAKVDDYSSVLTECVTEVETKEQIVAENLQVEEYLTSDGEASHITKEFEEMRQDEESRDPVSLHSEDREAEEKTEEIIDDSNLCYNESRIEAVTEVREETVDNLTQDHELVETKSEASKISKAELLGEIDHMGSPNTVLEVKLEEQFQTSYCSFLSETEASPVEKIKEEMQKDDEIKQECRGGSSETKTIEEVCLSNEQTEAVSEEETIADQAPLTDGPVEQIQTTSSTLPSEESEHGTRAISEAKEYGKTKGEVPTKLDVLTGGVVTGEQTLSGNKPEEGTTSTPLVFEEDNEENICIEEEKIYEADMIPDKISEDLSVADTTAEICLEKEEFLKLDDGKNDDTEKEDEKTNEGELIRNEIQEDAKEAKTALKICSQTERSVKPEAVAEDEMAVSETLTEKTSDEQIQNPTSALPSKEEECERTITDEMIESVKTQDYNEEDASLQKDRLQEDEALAVDDNASSEVIQTEKHKDLPNPADILPTDHLHLTTSVLPSEVQGDERKETELEEDENPDKIPEQTREIEEASDFNTEIHEKASENELLNETEDAAIHEKLVKARTETGEIILNEVSTEKVILEAQKTGENENPIEDKTVEDPVQASDARIETATATEENVELALAGSEEKPESDSEPVAEDRSKEPIPEDTKSQDGETNTDAQNKETENQIKEEQKDKLKDSVNKDKKTKKVVSEEADGSEDTKEQVMEEEKNVSSVKKIEEDKLSEADTSEKISEDPFDAKEVAETCSEKEAIQELDDAKNDEAATTQCPQVEESSEQSLPSELTVENLKCGAEANEKEEEKVKEVEILEKERPQEPEAVMDQETIIVQASITEGSQEIEANEEKRKEAKKLDDGNREDSSAGETEKLNELQLVTREEIASGQSSSELTEESLKHGAGANEEEGEKEKEVELLEKEGPQEPKAVIDQETIIAQASLTEESQEIEANKEKRKETEKLHDGNHEDSSAGVTEELNELQLVTKKEIASAQSSSEKQLYISATAITSEMLEHETKEKEDEKTNDRQIIKDGTEEDASDARTTAEICSQKDSSLKLEAFAEDEATAGTAEKIESEKKGEAEFSQDNGEDVILQKELLQEDEALAAENNNSSQTIPTEKPEEKILNPVVTLPSEEHEHETINEVDKPEEENMKEEETKIGEIDGVKTVEEISTEKDEIKEAKPVLEVENDHLHITTSALPSEVQGDEMNDMESKDESPEKIQEKTGEVEEASNFKANTCEKALDNELLTEIEDAAIKENLVKARDGSGSEVNQCEKTNEGNEIPLNEVSVEQVTKNKKLTETTYSTSCSEDLITDGSGEDEVKENPTEGKTYGELVQEVQKTSEIEIIENQIRDKTFEYPSHASISRIETITVTEENVEPALAGFEEKPKSDSEPVAEDQSNETIPEDIKSQDDETSQETKEHITEELKHKLKDEVYINREENENEVTKVVVLSEKVDKEVEKADGSEAIKEHVMEEESSTNELPPVSRGDEANKAKDYNSVSTECIKEAESREHIEAEQTEVERKSTHDKEGSHIIEELEERRKGEESTDPAKVSSEDREAEEKADIIDDLKLCHEESHIEVVTDLRAQTSLNDAVKEELINTLNISSVKMGLETIKGDANQETKEVEMGQLEDISSDLALEIPLNDNNEVEVIKRDADALYMHKDQVAEPEKGPTAELEANKTEDGEEKPDEQLQSSACTLLSEGENIRIANPIENIEEEIQKDAEIKHESREDSSDTKRIEEVRLPNEEQGELKAVDTIADKGLPNDEPEEKIQTIFSTLASKESEHGTGAINEEIEYGKTKEEIPKKLDAVAGDEITGEQTLETNKPEEKTTSSPLVSEEEENVSKAEKTEEEKINEADMSLDKISEDPSDAKKKAETCLEKQEFQELNDATKDETAAAQALQMEESNEQSLYLEFPVQNPKHEADASKEEEKVKEPEMLEKEGPGEPETKETEDEKMSEGEIIKIKTEEEASDAQITVEISSQKQRSIGLEAVKEDEMTAGTAEKIESKKMEEAKFLQRDTRDDVTLQKEQLKEDEALAVDDSATSQTTATEKPEEQISNLVATLQSEEYKHKTVNEVDNTEEDDMKEKETKNGHIDGVKKEEKISQEKDKIKEAEAILRGETNHLHITTSVLPSEVQRDEMNKTEFKEDEGHEKILELKGEVEEAMNFKREIHEKAFDNELLNEETKDAAIKENIVKARDGTGGEENQCEQRNEGNEIILNEVSKEEVASYSTSHSEGPIKDEARENVGKDEPIEDNTFEELIVEAQKTSENEIIEKQIKNAVVEDQSQASAVGIETTTESSSKISIAEGNQILNDIQLTDETTKTASDKQIPREFDHIENMEITSLVVEEYFRIDLQDRVDPQKAEIEDVEEIYSGGVEHAGEKTANNSSEEIIKESVSMEDLTKISSSDHVESFTKGTSQLTRDLIEREAKDETDASRFLLVDKQENKYPAPVDAGEEKEQMEVETRDKDSSDTKIGDNICSEKEEKKELKSVVEEKSIVIQPPQTKINEDLVSHFEDGSKEDEHTGDKTKETFEVPTYEIQNEKPTLETPKDAASDNIEKETVAKDETVKDDMKEATIVEEIPGEKDPIECKKTTNSIGKQQFPKEQQDEASETSDKVVVGDLEPRNAREIYSEAGPDNGKEKRPENAGAEKSEEPESEDSAKLSLYDLLQRSTRELQGAKNVIEEKELVVSKEEPPEEEAKTDEDEGDENSKTEPGIKPHKKSHNILSGVGSKVKHSISKMKKAITGKSSHSKESKPISPKESKK
uniref:Uncharacterized protein n=1 Tax=Gossypium raimondii TaxID=29730 RepID=A0A0D2PQD7_GOSRA|nr:hypothetical protein B456_001G264900 [Gossypium raimondii]